MEKKMRTETEQNMSISQWEDLCEGTYPGYGGTETEVRAYAALTEVLDEASTRDVICLMGDGALWGHSEGQQHLPYEHDQRITDLVKLLLHHGWTPPQHLAYTSVELTSAAMSPLAEEQLDFGEAMTALALEAWSSERGGDEHDAR